MQAATVYLVTNMLNGHTYVGVTRFTPEQRWAQHVCRAQRYDTYLARAIKKYGSGQFTIEAVASCLSADYASEVERVIIQRLRPIYNQTNGGEFTVGRKFTPEVRALMSIKATGRVYTPEQCAARSIKKKYDYEHNPTFKAAALAALALGRAKVDKGKRSAAAGKAARERVWSAASRSKLSASCQGRVYGPDVIERMRTNKIKPVVCPELDMRFGCVDEAAIRLGISTSSVYKVCCGARSSVNGLSFSYGG